ncbi:uncharacterized protein N7515_009509 [Penicillium bovifimosum]|uniref:Uncharacterized protein n=1 Tax=Penicillium bovifimosum TaxID=126998 RepID=A0A9W9GJF5_9EURO|nr:uncharacterized protein N7515_009509 [Penicillium bovifimosum]KAJ5121548.1 hypothetical protein N7515_009509 [Penicillium bovifimosum]
MATGEIAGGFPMSPMAASVAGSTSQGTTLQVPEALVDGVDLETWGSINKYDKLSSPTQEQTTGNIVYLTLLWKGERCVGRDLWNAFTHQFDDWDEEQWGNTTNQVQKLLELVQQASRGGVM